MTLTIREAATLLGKSERQVRYLIKTGQLAAEKVRNAWRIDEAALPLGEGQRAALAARAEVARAAIEQAVAPVDKATSEPPKGTRAAKRRTFSVTNLHAFTAGAELHRELSCDTGGTGCRRVLLGWHICIWLRLTMLSRAPS